MRSVVMKFGGSSVVDAAAIDRVCGIVAGELGQGSAPVVVVSARGGVTDALVALAAAARRRDTAAVENGVQSLRARHAEQAARLGVQSNTDLAAGIDRDLHELRAALDAIHRAQDADGPLAD